MYYKQYPPDFQRAVAGLATRDPHLLSILREGVGSVTRLEFNLRSTPSAKGDILEKHQAALAQVETDPDAALEAVKTMMLDLAYLEAKQRTHRACEALVPPLYRPIR